MSPVFLGTVREEFCEANVTVDWFHVVQLFTRAADSMRKLKQQTNKLPKAARWAVLGAWADQESGTGIGRIGERRLLHPHRLENQGKAALDKGCEHPPCDALVYDSFP